MSRVIRAVTLLLATLAAPTAITAQDNILIYGNSIVFAPTVGFFTDVVIESGRPAPNLHTYIGPDKNTSDYVNQAGLITSSLPTGQTWHAMIVQGGTVEMTPNLGDPALFQSNMLALAASYFGHSPNGLFVGHETGADHPNSTRYPTLFPSAAAWLGYSQDSYEKASEAIAAAHPSNPAPRLARQGTCMASTAGYPLGLFQNDLHHLSNQGKILCALLWYQTIYGGRIEDLGVDYSSSTPLVSRLLSTGISEAQWRRLVGFADRSLPSSQRPYPGSSGDFQLRISVNANLVNLMTSRQAVAGDTLRIRPFSPLGSLENDPAIVYFETLPQGQAPSGVAPFWLNLVTSRVLLNVTDMTGPATQFTLPSGLNGYSIWMQAVTRTTTSPTLFSDMQRVVL